MTSSKITLGIFLLILASPSNIWAKIAKPLVRCQSSLDLRYHSPDKAPSDYSKVVVDYFKSFTSQWVSSYKSALEPANNSIVSFFHKHKNDCVETNEKIAIESEDELSLALKECVFTSINAYNGPAITPENQEELVTHFMELNDSLFRFWKIEQTSLAYDIDAFHANCVVAMEHKAFSEYFLYLMGFTTD